MLECLLETAPAWASCTSTANGFEMTAAVPRAGGEVSRTYHLAVTVNALRGSVREAAEARLLPVSCPDRHINPDGAFCLGWHAEYLVDGATAALEWWRKLMVFLTCQETVHETRSWPEYAQMSHGDAAATQLEAEALAKELGLSAEYEIAMRRQEGPIAFEAKRVDLHTMHPRNGRSVCICGRTDKRGRPILRRQCWKVGLKCLPVLERRRQEEVKAFWATFRDTPCCGTVDGCPLRRSP